MPVSIKDQQKLVKELLKVPFLSREESSDLHALDYHLTYNIWISKTQLKFLENLVKKYGYMIPPLDKE